MIRAPMMEPRTVPEPPLRLAPPMMTAAMTSSSSPTATVGSPTRSRESWNTPESPKKQPAMAKTRTLRRTVGTPQSRAAASFDPSAKTCRPKTVFLNTSEVAAARAIATQTLRGPPADPQQPERDDERRHPQPGHRRAVQQADQAADADRGQGRRGRSPASEDQEGRDHPRERDRRADGQVDRPADDDERHPQGPDRHDDRLRQDDLEVVVGEEVGARLLGDREEPDDEEKADEGPCLSHDAADKGDHGRPLRPRPLSAGARARSTRPWASRRRAPRGASRLWCRTGRGARAGRS